MVGPAIAALVEAWRMESNVRFEALQRENATLRWMMGIGSTALSILIALMGLLD